MKRETLEKIRKIIVTLLVLFISILNTWIAFCTLPVHAEESFYINDSNISGSVVIQNYLTFVNNSGKSETDLREWDLDIPDPGFYALAPLTDSNSIYALYKFDISTHVVNTVNVSYTEITDWNEEGKSILHNETKRTNRILSFDVASWGDSFTNSNGVTYSQKWVNPFPVFESSDAMLNYCKTGDTSGIINGGSDLDPHDDAYAFTGFSMSDKKATWTGTSERSYLLDMDVEEWVNYTYGFATSEDQEVSSFIDAEAHYPTSDKKLALPWDEMEANKKEGEFIRQVNIIPCYGTSGAGFYFGLPCKVFYHKDGSVDKVELPASNGILSSDMERPVIVLNEASNGNPVGGDYSYFRFNNAQEDYFIEMKGRWYSTNDFDIYRENLVWKYKYQTILKNDLSSWVSVSDNVNSVGTFRFDVLGKSSWENLLSLYPVDNRNYEGGSFALFNKITGYSDALDTLKMLLKQPYSLYNGYEIYVRYYRYDDKGNLQYSKWTHFYNNLADAAGSSGSRLDDLNNMYSENQSDKGLTDDELSDLENTGNSRNDLDAVPKNNYDYSSLENATMNFFDLLTNFCTMLGQFPSMVAAVFGFLPSWLIGLFAVAIGVVIVCRFIGR